ncbi:deoxyribose-phosphate aldolase [Agrilactobacillus yilanensis]|uniref:Deoxyribose-phosphate aldolase n=1 Tax=Agrilactobacillus yilanensis TaxID=2485997 RepID=A0ABW4J9R5_9LACO
MALAQYLDHTLLKPEATQAQIDELVQEAIDNQFASVMVNPYWLAHVAKLLKGTGVNADAVIGFPLGANTTAIKVAEALEAVANGADEVDMVMNIGELKSKHSDIVKADIEAVVKAVHEKQKIVKVIIETALLTDDEITEASKIVADAGADFVKTSTGFSTRGASVHDVSLMYQAVGDRIKVKASGGIHSGEEAQAMIDAGAKRLGTSASLKIIGK